MWHAGLLLKLKSADVARSVLTWFKSYLFDRRQRVVLPGANSNWTFIRAGVPQGSLLGPLLFLLYINDIVSEIDSNIQLFADDTSLFIVVDNPLTAAGQLSIDLEKISQWATTWLVSFNPTKTVAMLFSRKLNKTSPFTYLHANHKITEVDSHKHLGLYLSKDCTWHKHINYITEKARTRINIMRRLKFKLDR